MSKRTSRRSAAEPTIPEPSRRIRSSRNEIKAESVEVEENDASAGPSKRSRPSLRARTKTADDPAAETDGDGEERGYSVRERKSVSYREVPVVDDEEDLDDLSSAGEEKDGESTLCIDGLILMVDTPHPRRKSAAPDTPSKRRKPSGGDEDDPADKAFKAERDKVGSGRGGFSVKGAAAAAARARWAKVRLAKEERGEVDDDSKERKKGRVVRRENRAAVEKLKGVSSFFWSWTREVLIVDGEVVTIRGVEYVVKNDELPIPDDPKGETKIDALGHLKGGKSLLSDEDSANK
jgi:chromatin structure-remodeling complex protein RSC7